MATDAAFEQDIVKLKDSPALERMLRVAALASDEHVRRYRALWVRGPLEGSTVAVAQGVASQQRGAAVEALAAQALDALARRLDAVDARRTYRVVTSMRVPSSIPAATIARKPNGTRSCSNARAAMTRRPCGTCASSSKRKHPRMPRRPICRGCCAA